MKVVGMTVKDDVACVAAAVAVVFIMQRLVQVADEMNHEFEGLCLSVFFGLRVFQDGEELLRLDDHAITVRALAGQSNEQLTSWVDGPLRKKWGALAAARTYLICQHGSDGKFVNPFEKGFRIKSR